MSDARPVLAVLGGSFNPPHIGHAMLPGYLLVRGDAARVLVAPCADHPLGKSLAPFWRRMAWVRAAMAAYGERVEVSAIEVELAAARDGRPSYTLELLEALERRCPDQRVRLVVGSDITSSAETDRWHRWDQIQARFDPIVVPRAGWSAPGSAALPEVSSTEVRAVLDRLRSASADHPGAQARLRSLVPRAVAEALERWIAGREPTIWIVGRGHVAHHVVPWLRERGVCVETVGARALVEGTAALPSLPAPSEPSEPSAPSEPSEPGPRGVWLLCRDSALEAVSAGLVGRIPAGTPVVHAAGARLAREALAPLKQAGHPVGTVHPICSLRRERGRSRLASASFGLGGDAAAVELGRELIGAAPWLDLTGLDARQRLAYHGACALVANHLAVIERAAADILRGLGLERGPANGPANGPVIDAALGELMLGSLENLLALGVPAGVTGPLARGDRATVDAHLAALDDEAARSLYAELSARLDRLLSSLRDP